MSDLLRAVVGPDPGAGVVAGVLYANLTVGIAVGAVALARLPVRRAFGPAVAYQLWVAPPIVALLTLLAVFVPSDSGTASTAAASADATHITLIASIWALGAVAMAAAFTLAQLQFLAEVRAGRGGPAVYGLIAPRIVLPADDAYTAEERELIRAHEREHVARKDPRAAALVAAFQCLCWFNPFAHLAAHLLRLDQELACDAAVIRHRPGARALYARTLLKTQLASQPLPFGCYWPARGRHPLELRLEMLKRRAGSTATSSAGFVLALADPIRP